MQLCKSIFQLKPFEAMCVIYKAFHSTADVVHIILEGGSIFIWTDHYGRCDLDLIGLTTIELNVTQLCHVTTK